RALFPYLARYRARLIFGVLTTLIGTFFSLSIPYLIGNAIDDLKNGRPQGDVVLIVGLILGVAAVDGVLTFFRRYVINEVSRRIEYELRNDLFTHLQSQ